MTRRLYYFLVRLHPPAFRRQFAAEMLWIFEEAAAAEGASIFFADGLVSLARQWLIREGTWKVAVAAIGGLLHISLVLSGLSAVLHR
jgi:hypothetical protein